MNKKIAIAYDNFSGNTGDLAIGLSLKKILDEIGVPYDEITDYSSTSGYETIIIGGGLLLRPDHCGQQYNNFKIKGNHILNCTGIYLTPKLEYLNEYKYVSVRSEGDKEKITYLTKEIKVVPCTTMLLEDLKDFPVLKRKTIGIHIFPELFKGQNDEAKFCSFIHDLANDYEILFIPITHYRQDSSYFIKLLKKHKLDFPVTAFINPLEIFTLIGKLDYFISCSLHGAIFAYVHNIPFILFDTSYNSDHKMKYFMKDRGLEEYLFKTVTDIRNIFLKPKIDYSHLISKDKYILNEHIYTLKQLLT